MKKQIEAVIEYLKEQPIKGVITGSCLLGEYWSGMDVDCFVYDEKSFNKVLFAMHHNPMFQILDPLELWKFNQFINKNGDPFSKHGVLTIKFTYNTTIPVNIILKRSCYNIFSVLSSFDFNLISIGYDIETKQTLDLSEDSIKTKVVGFNKWNTSFYDPTLWKMNRMLRQLDRAFKYYRRGFDTDNVVLKYIELIDKIQATTDIFNSENYSAKLKINKNNTKIIRKICEVWLDTHEITDKEIELLKEKLREI